MIKKVLAMGAKIITIASMGRPNLKRRKRVQGTLTVRGGKNEPMKEMKVRGIVPERIVLSEVVVTMESAYRALMSSSVAVRAGTW